MFTPGHWENEGWRHVVCRDKAGDQIIAIVPNESDRNLIRCAAEMYEFIVSRYGERGTNGGYTDWEAARILARASGLGR